LVDHVVQASLLKQFDQTVPGHFGKKRGRQRQTPAGGGRRRNPEENTVMQIQRFLGPSRFFKELTAPEPGLGALFDPPIGPRSQILQDPFVHHPSPREAARFCQDAALPSL
jgi:hypothetical protein